MSGDYLRGMLYALGIPHKQIAARAGLDPSVLSRLLALRGEEIPERQAHTILIAVGGVMEQRRRTTAPLAMSKVA